jgi:hypothetical protein
VVLLPPVFCLHRQRAYIVFEPGRAKRVVLSSGGKKNSMPRKVNSWDRFLLCLCGLVHGHIEPSCRLRKSTAKLPRHALVRPLSGELGPPPASEPCILFASLSVAAVLPLTPPRLPSGRQTNRCARPPQFAKWLRCLRCPRPAVVTFFAAGPSNWVFLPDRRHGDSPSVISNRGLSLVLRW